MCIADLDLHGLAVVVHRVVDDFNDGDSLSRTAPNPIIDLRSPGVVRPFRSRAGREGLEVETDKLRIRLRELDFEIEPPVVLVPGRVIDPDRQTRHAVRGGRRSDRSRRLGPRDVEKLNYVAVGIDPARVADLDLHRLAGGVDRVLNEREAHLRGLISLQNDVGVGATSMVVHAFGGGASRNRLEVDLHRVPEGSRERDVEHEVADVLGGAGVRDLDVGVADRGVVALDTNLFGIIKQRPCTARIPVAVQAAVADAPARRPPRILGVRARVLNV